MGGIESHESESGTYYTLVGAIAVAVFIPLIFWFLLKKDKREENVTPMREDNSDQQTNNGLVAKSTKKPKPLPVKDNAVFEHLWLLNTLKGHGASVLDMDFSSNGRYLASCSPDRAIYVWLCSQFEEKGIQPYRGNVDLDYASLIKFSPDNKALVVAHKQSNVIAVYKMIKKDTSGYKIQFSQEFPKLHDADIISIGIASNGKFVMSASADTTLVVWDLKGQVIKQLDTLLGKNNYAAVSPCGRFVACSGFTSEVKVWQVDFGKTTGDSDAGRAAHATVVRAFELKGHKSGVYCFAFNAESSLMATASKDGTFKVWNINVEYKLNQDPKLLYTGDFPSLKNCERARIALAPDGHSLAVASGRTLRIYTVEGAADKPDATMENVHADDISSLCFTNDSKFLASGGDKHIRVFLNGSGYKATALRADNMIKKKLYETTTQKERLLAQAADAKTMMQKLDIEA